MSFSRRARRTAWLSALTVPALVVSGLSVTSASSARTGRVQTPAAPTMAAAPALWHSAAMGGDRIATPRALAGSDRLVRLDPTGLPERAAGQRLGFDVGRSTPFVGRITGVDHTRAYTAWTGSLDGVLGTFTIVRAGAVYRAEIASTEGTYSLTNAAGDRYWLTTVTPVIGDETVDDAIEPPEADVPLDEPAAADTVALDRRKGRKPKITLMVAYTKLAKQVAGSKANIKATAALIAATTAATLKNSGTKTKIKLRGVVKVKGSESPNAITNLSKLAGKTDGKFRNVHQQRKRKHADLVHLLMGGTVTDLCGIGFLPVNPKRNYRDFGFSASYLSCVPNLTPTHEIGHNLGADHIDYPGVTHDARQPYAYGYADLTNRFITVMTYFGVCYDAGFDCPRIPFYSTPKKTFNGFVVGTRKQNNAKVIKKNNDKISRYLR